jgi:hypothetical protein
VRDRRSGNGDDESDPSRERAASPDKRLPRNSVIYVAAKLGIPDFLFEGAMSNADIANPHHLPPSSVSMIGHTDRANHQYALTDFLTHLRPATFPQ